MKISIIGWDWKDCTKGDEVQKAMRDIGCDASAISVAAWLCCDVDEYMLAFSDEFVNPGIVSDLFDVGDLWITDQVWEGKDLAEITKKIQEYAKAREAEIDDDVEKHKAQEPPEHH